MALAIANAFERAGYRATLAKHRGSDAVLVAGRTTELSPIMGDVFDSRGGIPLENQGVWCLVVVETEGSAIVLDVVYSSRVDAQRVLAETLPESVTRAAQEIRKTNVLGWVATASGQARAKLSFVLEAVERQREPLAQGDLIPLVARLDQHYGLASGAQAN